jgi:tRNA-dihydrouridine synthase B
MVGVMRIGPHNLANNVVLAPMAGVTDRPFRQLCRTMGRGSPYRRL